MSVWLKRGQRELNCLQRSSFRAEKTPYARNCDVPAGAKAAAAAALAAGSQRDGTGLVWWWAATSGWRRQLPPLPSDPHTCSNVVCPPRGVPEASRTSQQLPHVLQAPPL